MERKANEPICFSRRSFRVENRTVNRRKPNKGKKNVRRSVENETRSQPCIVCKRNNDCSFLFFVFFFFIRWHRFPFLSFFCCCCGLVSRSTILLVLFCSSSLDAYASSTEYRWERKKRKTQRNKERQQRERERERETRTDTEQTKRRSKIHDEIRHNRTTKEDSSAYKTSAKITWNRQTDTHTYTHGRTHTHTHRK